MPSIEELLKGISSYQSLKVFTIAYKYNWIKAYKLSKPDLYAGDYYTSCAVFKYKLKFFIILYENYFNIWLNEIKQTQNILLQEASAFYIASFEYL